MTNELTTALYDYAERYSHFEDALLQELERTTHLHTLSPRMLSGKIQGSLLTLISTWVHPLRILEIGTFTGYSALCMAKGLATEGRLITLEMNPEHAAIAQTFFERSAYSSKIDLMTGDAKKIIPTLSHNWDLVFIDADKEAYGLYYDMIIDSCRTGACILVDNVLWDGKVVAGVKDKKTMKIHAFNEKIKIDPRVENLLLPLRDGLQIIRKIA